MKAGLLGRTLGHSLSPQIHRFFGDYAYRLYEKEPQEVEGFLREGFRRGDFDFLNITLPYKRTVWTLCDELSPMARQLGNVNFVRLLSDGRLFGDNTDAFGFGRLLDSAGVDVKGHACAILGAGGAALTARSVLEERGAARLTLIRRGEMPAPDDELIVNATPVGMFPHGDEARIDIARHPNCRWVLDLVYNPSPTRLVREARACGKTAVDGMVMLIAQAYRAFSLMSVSASPTPLYLYGPPASGKSTWAKRLAQATGRRLVDLDAMIVETAARSIPEIFIAEGETGFRSFEKSCLKRLTEGVTTEIVALGGGTLLDAECRAWVERSGRIVVLDCPLEKRQARLTGADRPLASDEAKLEALDAARAVHYASFPIHLDLP